MARVIKKRKQNLFSIFFFLSLLGTYTEPQAVADPLLDKSHSITNTEAANAIY